MKNRKFRERFSDYSSDSRKKSDNFYESKTIKKEINKKSHIKSFLRRKKSKKWVMYEPKKKDDYLYNTDYDSDSSNNFIQKYRRVKTSLKKNKPNNNLNSTKKTWLQKWQDKDEISQFFGKEIDIMSINYFGIKKTYGKRARIEENENLNNKILLRDVKCKEELKENEMVYAKEEKKKDLTNSNHSLHALQLFYPRASVTTYPILNSDSNVKTKIHLPKMSSTTKYISFSEALNNAMVNSKKPKIGVSQNKKTFNNKKKVRHQSFETNNNMEWKKKKLDTEVFKKEIELHHQVKEKQKKKIEEKLKRWEIVNNTDDNTDGRSIEEEEVWIPEDRPLTALSELHTSLDTNIFLDERSSILKDSHTDSPSPLCTPTFSPVRRVSSEDSISCSPSSAFEVISCSGCD
jgi:hypothetical protein